MIKKLKFSWEVIKEAFGEFNRSAAIKDSAAISYYSIFSIPGLLIIIIWVAGNFFGEEAIRGQITSQIGGMMGKDTAKSVQDLIASALIDKENFIMKAVGVGSLLFAATTLFFQLQQSLNQLWDVEAAPKKAWLKFILDRANSLGMILVIGFLMISTMLMSTIISLFNDYITKQLGFGTYVLVDVLNYVIGFGMVVLLFALMFKVLPDIKITWKSVWMGALFTSILFTLGKFLLSFYFAQFKPTSAFGQAGTIILIMLWINYTCSLIFFGAELTKVYTYKKGLPVKLANHSKWRVVELYKNKVAEEKGELTLDENKSKKPKDTLI
ncbi:YihY/virulence factor BrkB family protein [Frigoriflavimonas asaccharolytica]|uniref:Membrane protein n=1 Tax=Frigoriflavimonas asaccharolytica TaxID=2735899 RepID=A0A8J8G4K2_9FLAO|nr:YihY/virulence factor BrkB family protein [Frigoriflavimonas asaccharolytica]NRS91043.1 membrane protein [Frigoriflavimonas asaccharolytica]